MFFYQHLLLLSDQTRESFSPQRPSGQALHWSQTGVYSLLPPDLCLRFYRAEGSVFPLHVDFHRSLPARPFGKGTRLTKKREQD